MKKIIIICFIFLLTGCVSEQTRIEIIEKLQKEKVIKSYWEQVDEIVNDNSPVPSIISYEYIYQDEDDKLNQLTIFNPKSKEKKINVTICYDVEKKIDTNDQHVSYYGCDKRKDFTFEKKKVLTIEYWKMTEIKVD